MEADAVIGIAQEGFPAGARFQDTVLVFPPQVLGDPTAMSDNLDHALGQVDVQIRDCQEISVLPHFPWIRRRGGRGGG
jgi:hypothetical protein